MSSVKSSVSPYLKAPPSYILLAHEKDELFRLEFFYKFVEALELFILSNQRWLFRFREHLNLLSDLLYSLFNVVNSSSTLGEEFTYITQFNSTDEEKLIVSQRPRLISKSRQAVYFLLLLCPQNLLSKLLRARYESIRAQTQQKKSVVAGLLLYKLFPGSLDSIIYFLRQLHEAYFLFARDIKALKISERVAKVQHVCVKTPQEQLQGTAFTTYRLVGALKLVTLLGGLLVQILQRCREARAIALIESQQQQQQQATGTWHQTAAEKQTQQEGVSIHQRCGICLDECTHPSTTPCGHLFCWDCIQQSALIDHKCPYCKQPCEARQIVQLMNF